MSRSKDYQRNYVKAYARDMRIKALRIVANGKAICCVSCGYQDIRALHIDHVLSDGTAHRERRGPASINLDIVRGTNTAQLQILCANCNWIKRHTNKEATGRPRINDDSQISMLDEWPEDDLYPQEE